MDSTNDFRQILAAVSRVTGIGEEKIFSMKRGQEFYDARWMVVQLLCERGYYDKQIADLVGMSQRNVSRIRVEAPARACSAWTQFRNRLEAVRTALGIQAMA